jgi:hypothetical protein
LWITYFKDATDTIRELTSLLDQEAHQKSYLEGKPDSEWLNIQSTIEIAKNLKRKFKDYSSIFEYYLYSTKLFASKEKSKKIYRFVKFCIH